MNLSMIRSGNEVFVNAECIMGYAFKSAVAGDKSILFSKTAMAANGSSFASYGGII